MEKQNTLTLGLELVWWLVTGIVAVAVLWPIVSQTNDYPFLMINAIFVIIFITFTRYIFLLKHTFLAKRQIIKALLIVISIPLIFYLVSSLNFFQTVLDEEGLGQYMTSVPYNKQEGLSNFIRTETLLFGVGAIITAIFMPFRMIMSIWRYHNRGME